MLYQFIAFLRDQATSATSPVPADESAVRVLKAVSGAPLRWVPARAGSEVRDNLQMSHLSHRAGLTLLSRPPLLLVSAGRTNRRDSEEL